MEVDNNLFDGLLIKIKEFLDNNNNIYDNDNFKTIKIGISGIPGSGKSTFSKIIIELINRYLPGKNLNPVIIPFDGFHKYKKELTEEQVKFRGRLDTFDIDSFKNKLIDLLNIVNEEVYFPSFDHEVKDPKENDIIVTKNNKIIIFEGLYLFTKQLDVSGFFDIKIFLQSNLKAAMNRVALRNFNAGISQKLEDSYNRVEFNDKVNALFVLENSDFCDALIINFIDEK